MRDMRNILGVTGLCLMLLLAGSAIEAADQNAGMPDIDVDQSTESTKRFVPMEIYGIRVLVDQSTGRMKALSNEQAAELSAELRSRFPGSTAAAKSLAAPKVHADGMVSAELDPGLMNYSYVRILPDGAIEYGCAKDHDHVDDLIDAQSTTPEKE